MTLPADNGQLGKIRLPSFGSLTVSDLIQDSYPALTPETFESVEHQLGSRFSAAHADFLLHYNGGYCHQKIEFHSTATAARGDMYVRLRKFFGITNDPGDYDDIRYHTSLNPLFWAGVPRTFIPLVETDGQDLFFVSSAGPTRGRLYFWSKEEDSVEPAADNVYTFLHSLQVRHDDALPEWIAAADWERHFLTVQHGDISRLALDLDSGSEVDLATSQQFTLLMCAAWNSWPRLVNLLLVRGASLHAQDLQGRDAIWYSVASDSLDCTRLLLRHGANPNSRAHDGRSLLDLQVASRAGRLYRLLVEHGAIDT